MTVTSATTDEEALTITIVMDFAYPRETVWQLYADPRKLERWWGPPTWPATFTLHDFTPGGRAAYVMTGPEGEKAGGWWEFTSIEPNASIVLIDGFADEDGAPVQPELNTTMTVTFESTESGTRVTSLSNFTSAEQLAQMMAMGMLEGISGAAGQMDDILAEG